MAAIGTLALAVSTAMAAPAAAAVPSTGATVASSAAAATALPNVNIDKSKTTGKVTFKPSKISTTWSAPPPEGTCTSALTKFTITNKTTATQTILYKKSTLDVLPEHEAAGICFWGTGDATFKLTLEGQAGKLTVTVS